MRASERPPTGGGAWRTVAALAGACLLTVVVAWSALIGPDSVFTGPGPTPSSATTTPAEETSETPFPEDEEQPVQPRESPGWVRLLVWLVTLGALLGAAFGAFLLGRFVKDLWDSRTRRPRAAREEHEFEVLGRPGAARDAVAADEVAQDAALLDGSPRNGIVAAWHRFEVQAADAGLQRHPWETSSEFVLRLLDLAGADATAVSGMAELYREARFSDHDLGEAQRRRAVELLARIRDGIRRSIRDGDRSPR